MKKITVLGLVLALVLATGSLGFAHGLNKYPGHNPNNIDDPARLTATINVAAEVGQYAAFLKKGKYETFSGAESVIPFTGRENEHNIGGVHFEIASNTPIKLMASFAPLKHDQWAIKTRLTISNQEATATWPIFQQPINVTLEKDEETRTVETIKTLQKVEKVPYLLQVTGYLGDIEHQAAGRYETNVILTIAAAD